jgi:hypothetical protein
MIVNLRDPAFASLDGEEREHGVETVVVMKILSCPDPAINQPIIPRCTVEVACYKYSMMLSSGS